MDDSKRMVLRKAGAGRRAVERLAVKPVGAPKGSGSLKGVRPVGKPRAIGDLVYASLKEAIVKGDLLPGQRLVEHHLSEQMRTSRVPIREALKKLEKDGLVEKRVGRGFVVKNPSRGEIEETFGIRAVLESYASYLATEQMNEATLNRLQTNIEAYKGAMNEGDTQKMMQLNTQFDEIIHRAAGSQKLYDLIYNFRDFISRYRKALLTCIDYARISLADHEKLVEAMRGRDKEEVERLVKKHVLRGKEIVLRDMEAGKVF
jgi:DNA-binding GntR family transcriptional regulator